MLRHPRLSGLLPQPRLEWRASTPELFSTTKTNVGAPARCRVGHVNQHERADSRPGPGPGPSTGLTQTLDLGTARVAIATKAIVLDRHEPLDGGARAVPDGAGPHWTGALELSLMVLDLIGRGGLELSLMVLDLIGRGG